MDLKFNMKILRKKKKKTDSSVKSKQLHIEHYSTELLKARIEATKTFKSKYGILLNS